MASSMGHLCSVCIAASMEHTRARFGHLKEESLRHHSPQNLQGQTLRYNEAPTHTQTHNREVRQGWRVVKAFIFCSKEKDPPDIPEGPDQSRADWFKLFVLDSTSITIRRSSVSDYSTPRKKRALSIRPWRNRFTPLDLSCTTNYTSPFSRLMRAERRLSLVLKEVIVLCSTAKKCKCPLEKLFIRT